MPELPEVETMRSGEHESVLEDREEHLPETLPQQLGRIGSSIGRAAFLTRRYWVPVACLLSAVALGFVQKSLSGLTIAIGLGPWWIDLPIQFLGGVIGVAAVMIGLWIATGVGSAPLRWGLGSAALLLVLLLSPSGDYPTPLAGSGFSDPWLWLRIANETIHGALWATAGLVIRGLGWGGFGRGVDRRVHVGIADLMLLTTAYALAVSTHSFATKLLASKEDVEFFVSEPFILLISIPIGILMSVLPLLPLLSACFPRGPIRSSAVARGALISLVLLIASRFAVSAFFMAMTGPAGGTWLSWSLVMSCVTDLGTVVGVIGVALATRWAGYRMRRVPRRKAA